MKISKEELKKELEELETKILAASVKYDNDPFFKCKKVKLTSKSLVQDKVLIIDSNNNNDAYIPSNIIKDVEKINDNKDITKYIITTTDNKTITVSIAI